MKARTVGTNSLCHALQQLFRSFTEFDGPPDPDRLAEMAARYGCELDVPATFPVVERHGLAF
ncbi:MAG: hypothetical protein H0X18_05325 [Geodermatophilaceae bacterium]|nr:hypothetical protein [Geodermatophilaceae bacterium]